MKIYRKELTARNNRTVTIAAASSYRLMFLGLAPEGRLAKLCVREKTGSSVGFDVDLFDCVPPPFLVSNSGPVPDANALAPTDGDGYEGLSSAVGAMSAAELELYRVLPKQTAVAGAAVSNYSTGNEGYSYRSGDGGHTTAVRGLWLLINPTANPGAGSKWEITVVVENDVG